ncbi:MAG TPA: cyclic nucleotide-binding domain-containing protein [Nannocystis exedens]|nr:cyclic nucleotide-binding domain-containing protein [Nannocystis exedens]
MLPDGEERLGYEREIARGGIGAIGIAVDRALHRHVAMKTLHARTYEEPVLVRGFVREAQITGQLNHPNIVPVHDFGVDQSGQLFFTMRLVEGASLKKILKEARASNGGFGNSYDQLLNGIEILLKVCDALSFAHSRGVIHCDIKAENIMVGDFGEVYLMDWGGAQLLPESASDSDRKVKDILAELPGISTEGMVFGTPAYMSPEQALGHRSKMDERSDIFSVGAILYEMICGRAPYRAGNNIESLRLAQRWLIPPLDDLVKRAVVPQELVRIAMKAMAKEPDDRYPSIEAMKLDLVRLVRGGTSFPTRNYGRDELIIREGELGDAAYIIASGKVEAYKTIDGERVSLRIMGPGEVFGEMAIFASSNRSASVIACEDTALIMVTSEIIHHELNSMKPWMGAFIRALATRFAGAERALIMRSNGSKAADSDKPAAAPEVCESIVIDLELSDDDDSERGFTVLTDVMGEGLDTDDGVSAAGRGQADDDVEIDV